MPQYMLKLPQVANIDAQTQNGTQPNQRIEKIFTKFRIPTQFSKIPNFQNPKHILHNPKIKDENGVRSTYLERILQRFCLKMKGFE